MTALWKYMIVECKLLLRGVFIGVLLAIVVGAFLIPLINNHYADDIGWYATSSAYRFMWFMFLLAQFLAVSAARRDAAAKSDRVLNALPYHSGQLILARLIALILPFGIVALLPACFYAYQSWQAGMAFSSMTAGLQMLSSYVIPMTFTILLGFWIGTWTRHRIVYLYSLGIVVFLLLFAKLILLKFIPVHWTYFADFGLTDLSRLGFFSELWGFTGNAAYWLHRLFYTALIIIIFSGIVYRAMDSRKEKKRNIIFYPIVAAAVVTMCISVFYYASIWQERTESAKQNLAFYRELPQENPAEINQAAIERFLAGKEADPNMNPLTQQHKNMLQIGQRYSGLTALDYDLKVNLEEKHRMEVQGTIRLKHGGNEAFGRFPLSLRHHFQVNEIKVDGMQADFEWEPGEDVVWVVPASPLQPRTNVKLTIVYAGTVNDWYDPQGSGGIDNSLDAHWERRVFIDKDQLFLPGYYGWYPYPGTDRLAGLEQIHFDGRISSPVMDEAVSESEPYRLPADFHVEVEAGGQMRLVANGERTDLQAAGGRQRVKFDAAGIRGFNLIGGDITEWKEANDHTALSITLSNQIPPAKAKPLTSKLLTHYTELAKIAKMLNPDAYYPNNIHFIRTDYPGSRTNDSLDNQLLYDLPLRRDSLKLIDGNGLSYLPYLIHPASMTNNGFWYFDKYLMKETVLASTTMPSPMFKLTSYMTDAISQFIEHSGNPQDGPLFIPSRHKLNGAPHPVYLAMNNVYQSVGKEDFPKVILQIYEYAQQFEGEVKNEDAKVDTDFTTFLNKIAAARP
ncbi:hypothetical protein [Paenibacillus eucommiae]|uniref:Uncharacterized protein n=1 Tax=Paenibacillus eucommiae TaxID=1355755 RepID=A0ABS4IQ82_9BACL|nr:hypothetical protein [Paenibacillus eucommiae]MBP1988769.1 hypothetical protein [Paenibacillus eucommiae]